LTPGADYFVRVDGDNVSFYDTREQAIAGGTTGRADLSAGATGTEHKLARSADSDAAQQGENASDAVSGQLDGAFGATPTDPNANKSSDGRLAGIVNTGADSISANKPTAAGVASALAAAPPPTQGTSAIIASNTNTTADGAITVNAVEDLNLNITAGGAAAGLVGVGAGISVVSIASNVSATAGGTLSAGGTLKVYGDLDEDVNVLALAGGVGAIGLGARCSRLL
jgi:hypothetical protein